MSIKWLLNFIIISVIFHHPTTFGAVRVVVDPGHGGVDRGCVHGGIHEADVALAVSKKLSSLLKKDSNFKVNILRVKDKDLSLTERVEQATDFKARIFVSIHANSSPDPRMKGAEFYIQNQMDPEEEAKFLASRENSKEVEKLITDPYGDRGNIANILFDLKKTQKILKSYELSWYLEKHWPEILRRKHHTMIRQGPFYVLSQNDITAVLIELGYLSHPQERKQLTNSAYQTRMAQAIYKGLKDYARNMDKVPSPALKP